MKNLEILVVDDDRDVLESTAMLLATEGYQVRTAESGSVALSLLGASRSIQVLLTDIVMPGGMNGFQLAEEAKRLLPHLCVIYATGYSQDLLPESNSLHGSVLIKPWDIEKLKQEVERCVSR